MKNINRKVRLTNITNREKRRNLINAVLPDVRKLVEKYDLAAVQGALKNLYENRKAEKELKEAEQKVEALRKKIG
jgi:2-phospho-L-lactate guanylyltransferase (CobY/MobA/RfbA family)